MDSRERETTLVNDLTKSRFKVQQQKEELLKVHEMLAGKITENESVRAENEVYMKEVSAHSTTIYLNDVFTRVVHFVSCEMQQ